MSSGTAAGAPTLEAEFVASTTRGAVRGSRQCGVVVFRGIPYGGGVSGDRRFLPAEPPQAWTGVRDAIAAGPRAVQGPRLDAPSEGVHYFTGGRVAELDALAEPDDEDCLVLNLLTPALDGGRRPVMVYLHGGGLASGSGIVAIIADRLAREQDVVVVSINHRLNVFGYLYLGDMDPAFAESGNVGMLDLVLALEWIRDNIEGFGGDPANVTLFGESGGGMKISTLLAMESARGLFHKAIIQSGSLLKAQSRQDATAQAERLLNKLGLAPNEARKLQSIPASVLFAAASRSGFHPSAVLDDVVLNRHPFEPDAPPAAAEIPLLVGACADEMTLFAASGDESLIERLHLGAGDEARVLSFYRDRRPDLSGARLVTRIFGDATFKRDALRQAERKSVQPAAVYRYAFEYIPPIAGRILGAFHTAELPLVFGLVAFEESEPLSRVLSAAWASFARNGDPSTPKLSWPQFDLDNRLTMVFDLESKVVEDPDRHERQLWEEFPRLGLEHLFSPEKEGTS